MQDYWDDIFYDFFREAVARFHEGNRFSEGFFLEKEVQFLDDLGCGAKEFFSLMESYAKTGLPSPTTILLMTSARRDFFLFAQKGSRFNGTPITNYQLPSFGDEFGGMPYLPRLIAKARAKLTGTMGDDVMYGCENDRQFFDAHGGIHPADFLRIVWSAGENDSAVYDYVRKKTHEAELAASAYPETSEE